MTSILSETRSTRNSIVSLVVVFVFAAVADLRSQQVPITAVCVMPDGKVLTGSDDGLELFDGNTLKPIVRMTTNAEKVYSIKVSPDQANFAVAGGTPADLGVVEVYSIENLGREQKTIVFGPFDDVASDCAWTSNEQLVACSMTGNCCRLPLDKTKTVPFNIHSKGILGIGLLDSGNVVTGGLDNTIGVWALEDPAKIRVLNNHVDVVNQIAVRPNVESNAKAMIVSVSDDGTARFWQPEIGRMVRFARLESIPTCVIWNRAGTRVLVGTQSGQVYVVDPATAKIVQTVAATGWINCLSLAPDDKSVLTGGVAGLQRVSISAE